MAYRTMKHTIKSIILLAVVTVSTLSGTLLVSKHLTSAQKPTVVLNQAILTAPAQPVALPASLSLAMPPVRLEISSIGVDADIIDVGVTSSGNLDVPHNYVQVGWYMNGIIPGQIGSAILDGHVDNGGFTPTVAGPFKSLQDIKIGDDISVTTATGSVLHFTVTSLEVYPTDSFPSKAIFDDTSGSLLKIVTCHGQWIPLLKTYNQRLVVTAALMD